ncbi:MULTISPECIES: PIG-L family deacetylase [Kitasatospora]|uniref:PLL-like beta propeller domain-containing protein n=1 Tax=Kitasatospora setae (strain ATCC 33774 / DSM 43861 / JCM 3304 / KCC A-0304 / NBRC 14216 / KM-6054) TaxID=452652 RepID=E4N8U0_KITSK|nr:MULTISPECIES: PIG-L family deacetylase [Kitasatospora]BAJ27621.1 hypothetical protein KSE_17960 [Kitasatospora setae KM-6054]
MKRRRAAVALLTALITTVSGWSAQTARAGQNDAASIVQIVAHEDDDLLFMNPDVRNSIATGTAPVSTIYLTAGEANESDPVAYAGERQLGIRLAYAQMAQVPCGADGDCWGAEELAISGHVVEHFWLQGSSAPVHLFFLDLPDGGDNTPPVRAQTLRSLWNDPNLVADTLDLVGSASWPQRYDKGDVQAVLGGLLAAVEATLVRVQDPAPDQRLLSGYTGDMPEHDSPDHITAAWFADAAVAQYAASTSRRVVLEHYRDYNISESPANLSSAETAEKTGIFDTYKAHDVSVQGEWAQSPTCKISGPAIYRCYPSRQWLRTPRTTQSVIADGTGALHAFVVESGKLFEWAENGSKVWQGPYAHGNPGGPLAAGIAVGRDQDGRIEVFGQRADTGEIVSRYQSGGGWNWISLGSPYPITPNTSPPQNSSLQLSAPAVAPNGDGRLQIFVRNGGGGISTKWQAAPNGGWSGWADMGGSNIQGTPAAMTNRDGRIELFAWSAWNTSGSEWSAANGHSTVLHWFQTAPNQPFTSNPYFPQVTPNSDLAVGMDLDGRLELLYRQLDSWDPAASTAKSYTMSLNQTSSNGVWSATSGALGGGPDQGGTGTPAVVTTGDGRILAAVRNRGGGVSVSRQGAANSPFGGWTDLGGTIVGVPAGGVDRDGRADLVVIGTNGRLYDNRQRADGSFGGWTPMGSS